LTITIAEQDGEAMWSATITGLPKGLQYSLSTLPSPPEARHLPFERQPVPQGPSRHVVIVQANSSVAVGRHIQNELANGRPIDEAIRLALSSDGEHASTRQIVYLGHDGLRAVKGDRCIRVAETCEHGTSNKRFVAAGNMLAQPNTLEALANKWARHAGDGDPAARLLAVMNMAVDGHAELRRVVMSGYLTRSTDEGFEFLDLPFAHDGEVVGRLRDRANGDWCTELPTIPDPTPADTWFQLEQEQYRLFRAGRPEASLAVLQHMERLLGTDIPPILGCDVYFSIAVRALTLGTNGDQHYHSVGMRALERVMEDFGAHWGDIVARDLETQQPPISDFTKTQVASLVPGAFETREPLKATGPELLLHRDR
jgi:hypothetical protein